MLFRIMKNLKKRQQAALYKNLEVITNKCIEAMSILDSQGFIRFLQDYETGYYVVFNGRLNQTFYAKSYQRAEKFFNNMVAKC